MEEKKEIKLKINDSELKGSYANHLAVMHSKYDFVLDFVSMLPPEPIVNARIITNPASLLRMYNTIGINLKQYEEKFGKIELINENEVDFPEKIN